MRREKTAVAAPFRWHQASSFREASEAFGAKLIAGGQTVIPTMKLRLVNPAGLIDISRVRRDLKSPAILAGRVRAKDQRRGPLGSFRKASCGDKFFEFCVDKVGILWIKAGTARKVAPYRRNRHKFRIRHVVHLKSTVF